MEFPSIILHIGTHKTGTTAVQDAMAAAYDRLLSEGVLYPRSGRPEGQSGQHSLAWDLMESKRHKRIEDGVWDELIAEIEGVGPRRVVISAEAFSTAAPDEIAAVRDRLEGYDVTILMYIREPLAYMRSAYKQRVKVGGYSASFRHFMESEIEKCDYQRIQRAWATCFGSDKVVVRTYEAARKCGLLVDFAEVAGLPQDVLCETRYANVSPSDAVTRVLRRINQLEGSMFGEEHPRRESLPTHRLRRLMLRQGWPAQIIDGISDRFQIGALCKQKDTLWLDEMLKEN